MSEAGKAEAQAPASETVAEKPVEETKVEAAAEAAEAEESPEAETPEVPVEGAEVVETEEEKKTKSKLRREKQKAHVASLEAEVRRLSEVVAATERSKPKTEEIGEEPKLENFDSEAKYTAALAAYEVRKEIIGRQAKSYEQNASTARTESAAAKMSLFKERAMALTDRYPDIEARVFNDTSLPMSATMAETLMESEKGPEVAYWLSANRADAQRIKSMSPLQAARELGRIEATIALPQPRKETKAPPPPTIVSGSGGTVRVSTTDASGDKLSADEWVKRERARLAARK